MATESLSGLAAIMTQEKTATKPKYTDAQLEAQITKLLLEFNNTKDEGIRWHIGDKIMRLIRELPEDKAKPLIEKAADAINRRLCGVCGCASCPWSG